MPEPYATFLFLSAGVGHSAAGHAAWQQLSMISCEKKLSAIDGTQQLLLATVAALCHRNYCCLSRTPCLSLTSTSHTQTLRRSSQNPAPDLTDTKPYATFFFLSAGKGILLKAMLSAISSGNTRYVP